jgi:hypothetical protein
MPESLNKKSLKALNKAIKLLRSAPRWIKGDYQQTAFLKGRDVECYCVVGALKAGSAPDGNAGNYNYAVTRKLVELACKDASVSRFDRKRGNEYTGEPRVTSYNDDSKRTYPQIMALLDRMKAKLEKKISAEA